jgi:acyl transferase domain-containing protein/aryl carrier-like protein
MNSEPKVSDASNRLDIAIIGIGCRFPGGANSPKAFWELQRNSVDAITEVPADRWDSKAFYHPDSARPGKINSRWGGFIERIDYFDARFFGISPREAARMDPQQRMLLEVAWEALEDGGQTLERLAGTAVGVFIGVSTMDYQEITRCVSDREFIDAHTNTGGAMSIAANRISYVFDFKGPSFAVDTACSSSLTAVHLATRSLRDGECELALVGGANALIKPETTMGFSRASMLSPDGRCKAFDASANGYTRSEGAGMVVLKPLKKALADGDPIYAVIRGTAINEDGRTSGITVPGRLAQEAMLRQAYRQAGVAPCDVQYIEAHGTGTPVGDPIEAQALGAVLGQGRPPDEHCMIGSVKTNIGHLEAGAGIAGLIRVALMMKHRVIPPTLHFREPNPNIPFDELRLRVPRTLEPWPNGKGPARAGVNSFGFGGANAHVVLEEAPKIEDRRSKIEDGGSRSSILDPRSSILNPQSSYLLPLSARSPEALRAVAQAYQSFLAGDGSGAPLSDLCYSASLRRSHHDYRLALVGRSHEELAGSLGAFLAGETRQGLSSGHLVSGNRPRLVFVFSGMGPQWWAMGRQMLEREQVFREAVEQCDESFRRLAGWSLLEEMTADESRSRMGEAEVAQPANFALQIALTRLWRSWGIEPDAIVGHSAGEVAAIHAAGVMSLEEAVRVIYHRSRLQQRATGKGKMVAAGLSLAEAERALEGYEDRISIAAINSPNAVTLSGDADAIAEIAQSLEQRQVFCRLLQVEIPYHSRHMEPIKDELMESLRELDLRPAEIPLYSTVTGRREGLAGGRELDAEYWWRNVRNPVLFAEAMEAIIKDGHNVFVELSPHPVLAGAVSEGLLMSGRKGTILPSLRRQEAEREQMLGSLGALYTLGCPVALESLYPEGGRFVGLPSYPWQRERYWQESEVAEQIRLGWRVHPLLGRRLASAHPSWELDLDAHLLPYLDDHRIQGAVVYPGAAYVEMALAAAREVFGEGPCALEEVEFQRALFLPDGEMTRLQMIFDPGAASFNIYSRTKDPKQPGMQQWRRHATGKLAQESAAAQPVAPPSLDQIRSRCARDISDLCYPALWTFGLEYGSSFQGIEQLWRGDSEALALIRAPESVTEDLQGYQFHPTLIDSCFQSLLGFLLAEGADIKRKAPLYLPVWIERLRVYGRHGSKMWSYARLIERTNDGLEGDVWLLDEDGNVLIEIQGFRLQALEAARPTASEALTDWLYEFEWRPDQPEERIGELISSTPETPGNWMIFADSGGVGRKLAGLLAARGQKPILITAAKSYRRISENRFQICPERVGDIHKLFEAVCADPPGEAGGANRAGAADCRGVIHLWSLDAAPPEALTRASLEAAQNLECGAALRIVQELAKRQWTNSPRLWLVTRGAQSVSAGIEPVSVAQSPLWGLGRVIVNEHPNLRCRMVDLCPPGRMESSQEIQLLFDELWMDDHEEEVAFRDGMRHVHRMNKMTAKASEADSQKRFKAAEDQPFRLEISEPRLLDALTLRETRREALGPGEVEIKVHAAGLNFMDVMKAVGIYPAEDFSETTWLGGECAGTVVAVGEGPGPVDEFRIGDEVVAVAGGCFSSFVRANANLTVRKPAHLSFEEAAAIPLAFLTVYYALHHLARLREGERILIHAAAGGVGLAAVQYAQRIGAEVFATAGSPEKRELLRSLGVRWVMDSRSLDFADEVMEITGGAGVDVVLNSLSGEAIPKSISVLGAYGRFLEIGKRDIYQNSKLGLRPFRNNLSYFAIDVSRLCFRTPEVAGKFFRELMLYFEDGTLRPVPHRAFPISDAVNAFRHMAQAKHTGKIVLSLRDQEVWVAPAIHKEGRQVLPLRSDGTYLITGGLGGFGLAIAQWMVERGARRLVLMGRSGASSREAETALEAMEQAGAEVVVAPADVSDEGQLADVLDNIDRFSPPLRGVVHAAMVLDDGFLFQLDEERFKKVMAPKAVGAWNLHTQTLNCPLDFFVLFSSVTSLIGNPGQANYCAANAFLDALAHYRRARNLPALTINWGAIGEVGYLARHGAVSEHLERQGLAPLSIADATAMLEHLLRRDSAQAGVISIDWQKWGSFMPEAAASPRFSHLIRANQDQQAMNDHGEGGGTLLDLILAVKPEERQQALAARLCEQVARVLGASTSELDIEQPLTSFGLDSIMAVEMSHWIGNELKMDLPTMALIRTPNLSHLAAQILDQLDARSTATSVPDLAAASETADVENLAAGAAVG